MVTLRTEDELDRLITGSAALKDVGVLGEGEWIGAAGQKRTGKGLQIARRIFPKWLAGVPVFHFGNLNFGTAIDSISNLADMSPDDFGAMFRNSIFNIDEVEGQLVKARANSALQLILSNIFNQSGHFNMSVYWTNPDAARIPEILHRSTQYMYWLDPKRVKKESWAPLHPGKPCHPRICNHCAAFWEFEPESPSHAWDIMKHRGVNSGIPMPGVSDCRTMPIKHTIKMDYVSQRASREGDPEHGGFREERTFHCAQRFYGLTNTDFFVDNRAAVLTSSNEIRERGTQSRIAQLRDVIVDMVEQGITEAHPQDVIDHMVEDNPGKWPLAEQFNVISVGRTLGRLLGINRRGRQAYQLLGWVEKHYEVDRSS